MLNSIDTCPQSSFDLKALGVCRNDDPCFMGFCTDDPHKAFAHLRAPGFISLLRINSPPVAAILTALALLSLIYAHWRVALSSSGHSNATSAVRHVRRAQTGGALKPGILGPITVPS